MTPATKPVPPPRTKRQSPLKFPAAVTCARGWVELPRATKGTEQKGPEHKDRAPSALLLLFPSMYMPKTRELSKSEKPYSGLLFCDHTIPSRPSPPESTTVLNRRLIMLAAELAEKVAAGYQSHNMAHPSSSSVAVPS